MAFLFWIAAGFLSAWLILGGKSLPRWLSALSLVVLSAISLFFALFSSVIPFRYIVGRPLIMIPLRLMMPALSWALCWGGALCAFISFVLAFLIWRGRRRLGFAGTLSIFLALVNTVTFALAAQYIVRGIAAPADLASAFGPEFQS